jgi:hypothetical protein
MQQLFVESHPALIPSTHEVSDKESYQGYSEDTCYHKYDGEMHIAHKRQRLAGGHPVLKLRISGIAGVSHMRVRAGDGSIVGVVLRIIHRSEGIINYGVYDKDKQGYNEYP